MNKNIVNTMMKELKEAEFTDLVISTSGFGCVRRNFKIEDIKQINNTLVITTRTEDINIDLDLITIERIDDHNKIEHNIDYSISNEYEYIGGFLIHCND